ncbi:MULTISPECIES: ATP-binding protein [Exiguobacterium]|uniref:PAS domain-containing sensor histidine kinase n=1 Tax=Exiguobacterium TaxID=33986 RepID=UPI000478D6BF|nr:MULTISPECIES: ATP-binding protein [Exiguobacterium]MCT4779212.1 ATP-binding protein [Exiguobacterium soli]
MAEHSSPSSSKVIHATLRALEEPVVLVDRRGVIDFANPAFHKQFMTSSTDDSLSSFFGVDETTFPISDRTELVAPPYTLTISPVEQTDFFLVTIKSLDLNQLLSSTLDASLLVTDSNFLITALNETASTMFGFDNPELLHKMTPISLHDRNEFQLRKQHLEQLNLKNLTDEDILLLHGRDTENEWTYHRKDGSHFHGRLYMTRLAEGGFFLFITDISAQKQVETHLAKSERRFRLIAESVLEAVIFHDNGIILDANRAAEIIFRTKLELMKGHRILDFIQPEFQESVIRRITAHYEEPYEVIGRRADETSVEIEVFPREITYDKTRMRVAVVRDISERKKIEKMLEREKNAIMRQRDITQSILQASNEGFLLTEEDGSFIYMNVKARKLLDVPGIAPSKIQERISMIPSLDLATRYAMLQQVEELFAGKHSEISFRFTLQQPDESSNHYFEFYATSIKKEKSRFSRHGFLFVFRDRTEEQKMDQVKDELVSTVSHELRTPLSSILGFMELLRYRQPTPEKTKRYIQIVHDEAKRLTTLLNDFLDIQRMEGGKEEYAFKPFSLRQLLLETIEHFGETAETHTIHVHLNDDPILIFADEDKVKQVIINLLSNAIKYSPSSDHIDVRLEQSADQAILNVRDYGLGIPQNAFDKLFTKFYRVDNSDVRKIGGTGLGLAICKEIIESHGGAISVESELNHGSTFTIVLELDPRKDFEK